MKSKIKCGIAAAVVVAAGFAAYQSYGAYGAQDNSLLMQNIEALAQSTEPGGDPSGDPNGDNGLTSSSYKWKNTHIPKIKDVDKYGNIILSDSVKGESVGKLYNTEKEKKQLENAGYTANSTHCHEYRICETDLTTL